MTTTLTARIRPASRSARSLLETVGPALRQRELVGRPGQESLTEAPEVVTLVVTELPGEILVSLTGPADAQPASVRRALSQEVRHAAGSRSAAAKLVITWTESPSPLAAATL